MAQRRRTHQRDLVREAVGALGIHPTAAQVYEYVHDRDERISLATVYRNLNLLVDEGDIMAVETTSGRRYDHRLDEHAHLVCTQCGTLLDVTLPYDDSVDERVSEVTSFAGVQHRLVFEGVCPACAQKGLDHSPTKKVTIA